MADVFSAQKRSQLMAQVRSSGNRATELALLSLFKRYRIKGWRRNYRLFGRPDFVFPRRRLAIFVDGCFWHGCPLHASQPATNYEFWKQKLVRNKKRDRAVTKSLRSAGWRVLRIWQHTLKRKNEAAILKRVQQFLSDERRLRVAV